MEFSLSIQEYGLYARYVYGCIVLFVNATKYQVSQKKLRYTCQKEVPELP